MRERTALLATIGLYGIYFTMILAVVPPRGAGVPVFWVAVALFVWMSVDLWRGVR